MLICCYRTKGREGWHESLPSWQLMVEASLLRLKNLRYRFCAEQIATKSHAAAVGTSPSGGFDASKNAFHAVIVAACALFCSLCKSSYGLQCLICSTINTCANDRSRASCLSVLTKLAPTAKRP